MSPERQEKLPAVTQSPVAELPDLTVLTSLAGSPKPLSRSGRKISMTVSRHPSGKWLAPSASDGSHRGQADTLRSHPGLGSKRCGVDGGTGLGLDATVAGYDPAA